MSKAVPEQEEGFRQASPSAWAGVGARLRIRGKRGVRPATESRGFLGSMVPGNLKSGITLGDCINANLTRPHNVRHGWRGYLHSRCPSSTDAESFSTGAQEA